jgi:hypothetical protein
MMASLGVGRRLRTTITGYEWLVLFISLAVVVAGERAVSDGNMPSIQDVVTAPGGPASVRAAPRIMKSIMAAPDSEQSRQKMTKKISGACSAPPSPRAETFTRDDRRSK